MSQVDVSSLFPFPSFRQYQRSALEDAIQALDAGKSVLLDLPTGIGKSPINIALCNHVGSAYYTTPQRELRSQLQDDADLQEYYHVLEARADYICGETGANCDECEFYNDPDLSCNERGVDCTYMEEIVDTMRADVAVLTMSRLLISGQKEYAQFLEPRDLLIVDEAQSLEDQTASMHANIELTVDQCPEETYGMIVEEIHEPDEGVITQHDIWDDIVQIHQRINGFVDHYKDDINRQEDVINAKSTLSKMEQLFRETRNDRDWVVNLINENEMELKPVEVDWFLRSNFWSMTDQVVLSTATVPYRGDEERWLSMLGLNPDDFEIISRPSPFPPTNRLIHTMTEICKMSQEQEDHWEEVLETLDGHAKKHAGTKGLVHTASYERANDLVEDAQDYPNLRDNMIADEQGESLIEEWQESDCDIFCSPATTEGVSLDDDMCRWQVLLKVPYPHPDDSRIQYMLDQDRWYWYNQKAAVSVLQSVGRAVRSEDDHAEFYVYDASFEDVRRSVTFPDWFNESIY